MQLNFMHVENGTAIFSLLENVVHFGGSGTSSVLIIFYLVSAVSYSNFETRLIINHWL